MAALSPFELIKKGALGIIDKGKGFFNAPDNSTQGIIRNTLTGIPKATKDVLIPTRGYTEGQLKDAKPSFKETALAVPKAASEIYTGIGRLGSMGAKYIPGYNTVINKAVQTKTGGLLSDVIPKLEQFQAPKTVGEAKAMRFLDVVGLAPIGSLKNIGTSAKVISKLDDVNAITKELKGLGLSDDAIRVTAPKLIKETRPETVANIISDAYSPEVLKKVKQSPEYPRVESELGASIELSEAGFRYKPNEIGAEYKGVSSTFPKWIPDDLRSKKLMEKVYGYIENGTLPKTNAVKEKKLYNLFVEKLDNDAKPFKTELDSLDEVAQQSNVISSLDPKNYKTKAQPKGHYFTRTKKIIDDYIKENPNSRAAELFNEQKASRDMDRAYARALSPDAGNVFKELPKDLQDEWAIKEAFDQETGEFLSISKGDDTIRGTHWWNAEDDFQTSMMPKAQASPLKTVTATKTNELPPEAPKAPQQPQLTPERQRLSEVLESQGISPQEIDKRIKMYESYTNILQDTKAKSSDIRRSAQSYEEILDEMTDPNAFPVQKNEINSLFKEVDLPNKLPEYTDIGNIRKGFQDMFRISEKFFDKDTYKVVKERILDPFDASKGRYVKMKQNYSDELNSNIVKGLGIGKGSKESEILMKFGEKRMTFDEVAQALGRRRADDIVKADQWFRKVYDELIDQVNLVRLQIYPNNPAKLIPKRQDYYRHFSEMGQGFEGLKNIFEKPSGIDPMLSGISPFTRPKSKWLSIAQKRLGLKTKEDAVGGFLDYLPSAAYASHIDPHIGTFRALANKLATQSQKSKNVNNMIDFLNKYANSLAGKTNDIDRIVTDWVPGGRKTVAVLDWANRRIKANTILANLSSSISQIFNVPQGIASAKQYSANGLLRTMGSIFSPNEAMKKSTFINERYFKAFDKFDTGFLNNSKKFASWMTGVLDEVGTKFIWNSHYEKALKQGIQNPAKYADDITRKMVAGRGVGEAPLVQQSKVFQMVAPFQLEVANLWSVMGDFVKAKDFGALAGLMVANYVFNRVAEDVRGNPVSIDPIQAAIEAYSAFNESDSPGQGFLMASGRLGGEALSNLPLGQTLASMYPQYGGTYLGVEVPTRKELFGRADPTRFGSPLMLTKGVQEPLYKLIPPFGGAQLKKTIEGVQSLQKGGSFNKGENLEFTTPESPIGMLQTIAFGKYSTPEARSFFNKPLEKRKERASVLPLYKEVQKLKDEGKIDEAKAVVNKLTDEEYEVYKGIKKQDTTKETLELKKQVLPTYRKVQKLKDEGKLDEAKSIVNALTDEEYRAYKLIKDQLSN